MLRRTALVRGPAAASAPHAKPRGAQPRREDVPKWRKCIVFRRNELKTGWEQFLSNFQVSSFHQELIETVLCKRPDFHLHEAPAVSATGALVAQGRSEEEAVLITLSWSRALKMDAFSGLGSGHATVPWLPGSPVISKAAF